MSTDDSSQAPVRHVFFSPGWFDMVIGELQAMLLEHPAAKARSFSLIERFENAPDLGLAAPYECAGLRLDIAGGDAQLRRGVHENERASVVILTKWDDAARAVMMPTGEEYACFCAWRTSSGRYRREGDIDPAMMTLLASMHDWVAQRTSAYRSSGSV